MANQALAPREQTGVAQRQPTEYDRLRHGLERRANDFAMALPSHITPEKFQRTVMTAAQSNPDLLKADRASLITACMKAAQDGLLPDGREAALVTFNASVKDAQGRWAKIVQVQYMPMVYGLRKKILQSGEISTIVTGIVYRREYEEGYFVYEEGSEAMLRHKPMLDLADEDATDDNIVAAYSLATMKDGSKSFKVMSRAKINKVRQTSKTGALGKTDRQGKPIPPKGPWVDWFDEMAQKTVLRNHSKTLPMSGDIIDIEAHDETLAARSATALLDSTEGAAPRALPPRREDVAFGYDTDTGEIIEHDDRSDEDVARELDRQGFAEMDGQADDESDLADEQPKQDARAKRSGKSRPAPKKEVAPADDADDDAGGTEPHPGTTLADELIKRLEQAEVLGTAIGIESEFAKHAEAMLNGDAERVKLAIANTKKRFGK